MYDYYESEPPPPRGRAGLVVMVLLASIMIGVSMGVLLAGRDASSLLRWVLAGMPDQTPSEQPASTPSPAEVKNLHAKKSRKQSASRVIPTGFPSIGTVRYSSQSDGARFDFDLESMDPVGAGELASPDRIYIDLEQTDHDPGAWGRLEMQKTLSINGDLVTRVRLIKWESGMVQIVLDLKQACSFTYQAPTGPQSRLHIELRQRTTGALASKAPKLAGA